MSTKRLFGFVFLAASLHAQLSEPPGVSHREGGSSPAQTSHNPYSVTLRTASGDFSVGGSSDPFALGIGPDVPNLPMHSAPQPGSSVVSLHELQHPIPKKAVRDTYQAAKLARAHKIDKAIAKLEEAIRIDPDYRDAHANLGVEYLRTGRIREARAEFQKALDIGPPALPIYADLALISLAYEQYREAEAFARKALALEPGNAGAKRILEYASQHSAEFRASKLP